MEALRKKMQRLDTLVKVEELSVQELQAQRVAIKDHIENVEKQQQQLHGRIDLIQLQVRQATGGDGFFNLQNHHVQQTKAKQLDTQLVTLSERYEQLNDQRIIIDNQLSELRSKIKGYERIIGRYKNYLIEVDQRTTDKVQDGLIAMRTEWTVYG